MAKRSKSHKTSCKRRIPQNPTTGKSVFEKTTKTNKFFCLRKEKIAKKKWGAKKVLAKNSGKRKELLNITREDNCKKGIKMKKISAFLIFELMNQIRGGN